MPVNNILDQQEIANLSQESSHAIRRHAFRTRHIFPRDQTVKLLIQCLYDYGYNASAKQLEDESGFSIESGAVGQFREGILGGDWKAAHLLLNNASLKLSADDLSKVRFLLYEQEYLELLEAKKPKKAVQILQNELTPLGIFPNQVKLLSSLIMCLGPDELYRKAGWDGALGQSRSRLLMAVQAFIPPGTMIPEGRLETLLAQATQWQCEHCLYHNNVGEFSLMKDHCCDRSCFPSVAKTTLSQHDDEVWHVAFSHNGKYLASGSRDKTAIIWDTATWKIKFRLRGHKDAVAFLAFSSNDSKLITTSNDHTLRIWSVETGKQLLLSTHHKEAVVCAAWVPQFSKKTKPASISSTLSLVTAASTSRPVSPLFGARRTATNSPNLFAGTSLVEPPASSLSPVFETKVLNTDMPVDSTQFVSASLDKTMLLCDLSGSIVHKWTGPRVTDCRITDDGAWLISVCQDRCIRIHDLHTRNELFVMQERNPVTSIGVSVDKQFVIANLTAGPIHLWSLQERRIVQSYLGHVQDKFVIRSCFGGVLQNFVLSGSEDSLVYVWSRDSGTIVEKLVGHSGCVNSVSWNSELNLFASASDDHSIMIWGPNTQAGSKQSSRQAKQRVSRKKKYPKIAHGTSRGARGNTSSVSTEEDASGDSVLMSHSNTSTGDDGDYFGHDDADDRDDSSNDDYDSETDEGHYAIPDALDDNDDGSDEDDAEDYNNDEEESSHSDDLEDSEEPDGSALDGFARDSFSRDSSGSNVLFIRRWYP